jgi:hypothetical protein
MSSLLESLSGQLLGGDTVGQLSRAIGADEGATTRALTGALPMLVGGIAGNTSRSDGAQSLAGALDRDHDGSVLDDVAGFLQGGAPSSGAGILGHVFGGRKPAVEQSLSRSSGLNGSQVTQLLAMVAPLVMGYLGREKRQQGFDAGGLASMLGGARDDMERQQPGAMGALAGLLDADGDGSVMDDVADLGSSLLGGFLKGRR